MYLIAFSKYGNKLHIYSLDDFQLKFCFFLINAELNILNVSMSIKNRFLFFLSFNGKDLNLNALDLKNSDSEDHLCQCDEYDDENVKKMDSSKQNHSYSFFGGIFNKLSDVSFYLDSRQFSTKTSTVLQSVRFILRKDFRGWTMNLIVLLLLYALISITKTS